MAATLEQIVTDALALPTQARAFVAERLIESLDPEPAAELSPAWRDAVRRRCREADQGLVEMLDADEVFNRALSSL